VHGTDPAFEPAPEAHEGSFLYGVTPTSIHVFAIATGVLTLAALIATILPARRAAAIDPMVVLKE